MEHEFWHQRWQDNQIGFHQPKPNGLLVAHLPRLGLSPGARVFLPLCGKTLDAGWLLSEGFRVVGAELSRIAVEALFDELGLTPEISRLENLELFSSPGLEVFVGDIFDLDANTLGPVDAVFDRAALVALPQQIRARYAAHMGPLSGDAPQLLVTFDYDQAVMAGPPFAVPAAMVTELYADSFQIDLVAAVDVPGGLKGFCKADEVLWHLTATP